MSVNFVESSNSTNPQQNHSLQNMDNYKTEFSCNSTEIFSKYIGIITEYFINCSESINIQNESYYKYVIIKGMETVAHVFRMLLLYTKNLNLTYYHCQKSFYYYVEFISQIGDNNHSFLQLNSRDASLFVYKKTIYEINQEFRKSFTSIVQENIIMNNVEILIYMYNCVISDALDSMSFSHKNKKSQPQLSNDKCIISQPSTPSPSVVHSPIEGTSPILSSYNSSKNVEIVDVSFNEKVRKGDIKLMTIDKDAIKLAQIILNVSLSGDEKYYYNTLQIIRIFFDKINLKNKNLYIDIFIKKIKKNMVTIEYLDKRFRHDDHDSKLESLTPLRYINWLMLES